MEFEISYHENRNCSYAFLELCYWYKASIMIITILVESGKQNVDIKNLFLSPDEEKRLSSFFLFRRKCGKLKEKYRPTTVSKSIQTTPGQKEFP